MATAAVFANLAFLLGALGLSALLIFWRYPVVGIYAVLLAAGLSEFGRIELGEFSFLLLDLVALSVLGIWVLKKIVRKERFQFGLLEGSLIGFWLFALISLLLNEGALSPAEFQFAFLFWARFVVLSGIFLVVRELAKQEAQQKIILLGIIFTGIILTLLSFGLLQIFPNFAEAGLTELGFDPHIGRLTGPFLDPNFFAGALTIFLSLIGGQFLVTVKKKQQIFWLSLAGVLLVAFFLTFSRSGLLALATAGFILGSLKNRKLLLGLVISAVLAGLFVPRLQDRLGELHQSLTALGSESQQVLDPTAELRVRSWEEGLTIWQAQPILGVGFGAYKFHQNFVQEVAHSATGSDASLITVLATTGLGGLILFLFFWISLLWELGKKRSSGLALGALAGILGIFVHAVFVNAFFFAPILAILLIVGALGSRANCAELQEQNCRRFFGNSQLSVGTESQGQVSKFWVY